MSDEDGGAGDGPAAAGRPSLNGYWATFDDIPEDLTWDDLSGDVTLAAKDGPAESDPVGTIDERERRQVLEFRETLFKKVNRLVWVTTFAGIVLMAAYMMVMRGSLDYRVIIAWYSSMALQTIGLLAVIAKNLFPNGDGGAKH